MLVRCGESEEKGERCYEGKESKYLLYNRSSIFKDIRIDLPSVSVHFLEAKEGREIYAFVMLTKENSKVHKTHKDTPTAYQTETPP